MIRLSLLVFIVLISASCGPAKIFRQTYQAEPYEKYVDGDRKVYVGISASREVDSKIPFYYSDIQIGPYELLVIAHSDLGDSEKFMVKSAKISFPDREGIDLVVRGIASSCSLQVSKSNSNFNDCYVYLPFGDLLEYKENYGFSVEIIFQFSDTEKTGKIEVKMESIEELHKGSTFDVMMSV
jgi:hypothetical protein